MSPRENLNSEKKKSDEMTEMLRDTFLKIPGYPEIMNEEIKKKEEKQRHKTILNPAQRKSLADTIASGGVFGQKKANERMQRDMDALVPKEVPNNVQTKTEPATLIETKQEQKIMESKFKMNTNPVEKPKTPQQNWSEGYDTLANAKREAAAAAKEQPTIKNWQDEAIKEFEKSGKNVLDAELVPPSGSINTVVTPTAKPETVPPLEKAKTPLQDWSEGSKTVKVRRTSGEIEDDWKLVHTQGGLATVMKRDESSGKFLTKVIPESELNLTNQENQLVKKETRHKINLVQSEKDIETKGFHTLDIEQAAIMIKAQEELKAAEGAVEARAEKAKVPFGIIGEVAEAYKKMGDGLRWLTVGALVYSNKFAPSFRWLMVGGLLSAAVATLYMGASNLLEHASVIDTSAAFATIREGEGVTHVLSRQLAENPVNFGFSGNLNDANEVKEWSISKAYEIAKETGYADTATGVETRVGSDGIDKIAYVLQKGDDDTLNVVEKLKGDDGIFRIRDINNSTINANEYQHNANFAPTAVAEPSAEDPATEPTGFTKEGFKPFEPVIPVVDGSPSTNLTTEGAPVGQEAGNANALVEAGTLKGTFQYGPKGEVVGFITNQLGASADGRDLLNDDWRSAVRNHSLNGVTDGLNISVVDERASTIAGYEQAIAVLEQDGINNKPKIDFLRDQIQDIITKTEATYGDVFKDSAINPPEPSSHINLPTDPQALAQLNADATKATDLHIKSVFGKEGWFGIGADNGQKTFEAFADMPVNELLAREARIPSEDMGKALDMVKDASKETGLPLNSGLSVRDHIHRANTIVIQKLQEHPIR